VIMPQKHNKKKLHTKPSKCKPLIYDKNDEQDTEKQALLKFDITDNNIADELDITIKNKQLGENTRIGESEQRGAKLDSQSSNQPQEGKQTKGTDKTFLKALSFFSQVGITMAACVFIGVLLGKFLDDRFGTSPWLLLAFSLLGAMAAFKALFDLAGKK